MRRFITVAAIAIFIGLIAVFLFWSSQPSRGTSTITDASGNEVKGASVVLEEIATKFFRTKITSNMKLKSKSEAENAAIRGQYLFIDENPYKSDQLAITVGGAKSPVISEISPVQFRKTLPQEYEEVVPDASYPEGTVSFSKVGSYEKSAFWIFEDVYIGVVASGGADRKAELDESMRAAILNLTWN